MKLRDGDLLMLTNTQAAGCLVAFDSSEDPLLRFYNADKLAIEIAGLELSPLLNHFGYNYPEQFMFIKIGRWK